jgi:RNA 2',3'-cyclic 3'-phosphodiesterase
MRLFIALDLPDAVSGELSRWRDSVIAGREGLRAVPHGSLHLTLAFLGETDPASVDAIREAVDVLAGSAQPRLAIGVPFWLPRRRPSVLTVSVDDDDRVLHDTHDLLSSALHRLAGADPEGRIFFPHVTVARVRQGFKVRPVMLKGPEPVEFTGAQVTLYRSSGSYEPLHTVQL